MSEQMTAPSLTIRQLTPADEAAVRELLLAVYPSDGEARLVHKLRHCGALVLEQVAVDESGAIVGHVAYSRVTNAAIGPGQAIQVVCLSPVSVLPKVQRQGVGDRLIRSSLKSLSELEEDLVLVLGPPAYFPRFGFDPELAKKIHGPYAGGAFMALALTEAGTKNLPIEVAFATPFEEFE
ncbi:GNAT family N-acetyltransferase [Roseibium sp.]|uniref:GNAT family N-acetyltransferase n=1 Tax=Roseibium sp. TaxID=1936156 RepID=UPI003B517D2E